MYSSKLCSLLMGPWYLYPVGSIFNRDFTGVFTGKIRSDSGFRTVSLLSLKYGLQTQCTMAMACDRLQGFLSDSRCPLLSCSLFSGYNEVLFPHRHFTVTRAMSDCRHVVALGHWDTGTLRQLSTTHSVASFRLHFR